MYKKPEEGQKPFPVKAHIEYHQIFPMQEK